MIDATFREVSSFCNGKEDTDAYRKFFESRVIEIEYIDNKSVLEEFIYRWYSIVSGKPLFQNTLLPYLEHEMWRVYEKNIPKLV